MKTGNFPLVATVSLAAVWLVSAPGALGAEPPAPPAGLTGQVTTADEGPMEGVLVSAKKTGSTVTITVASDEHGGYAFPRNRLEPGRYALHIRAVGYDLDDPGVVEVSGQKPATADLKLHKVADLTPQLTNSEWLMSFPGTDQQRGAMLNCVGCHTLQRIAKSKHTAEEFVKVQARMSSYTNQSTPTHIQKRLAERVLEDHGEGRERARRTLADYLASINLSSAPTWQYSFKTLPRPRGPATRYIVTEYDLPRASIEPHDVVVDGQGAVWYSNFGEQKIGKLDPKTGKVTEYTLPEQKHGSPTGELGLQFGPDGNPWFGLMYQAGVAKFDRKTEEFQVFTFPPELNHDQTQVNMVLPQRSSVDGKVWMQNNGFATIQRLDLASGKFENFDPYKNAKPGEAHDIYDIAPDSHNNAYFTDFAAEHIGRIDAKTGEITFFATPTPKSAPRRGQMDAQDRLWFGEYRGNRIGMFDTRTQKFVEWEIPTPFSAPYDVALDKNGNAWTGSMSSDRLARLDPKTGQFTEFLLPRETNIRRMFVDNSGPRSVVWVGNNHGASIMKLEVLN